VSKRILYFQYGAGIDGSGGSLLKILRAADGQNLLPLVVLHGSGPLADQLQKMEIAVDIAPSINLFGNDSGFSFPWWHRSYWSAFLRYGATIRTAQALIKKHKPDLIHINNLPLVPVAIAARQAGIPVILHVREYPLHGCLGLRRKLVTRMVQKSVDLIIGICQAGLDAGRFRGVKQNVIYNWISWARNPCEDPCFARKTLGFSKDESVLLFMGGESSIKGGDWLLHALSRLPSNRAWKLIWLGSLMKSHYWRDRKYKKRLTRLMKQRASRILRIDESCDVTPYLRACDFLVAPHRIPHFANPVVEAAWYGCPSIMTNDAVGRELIEDGHTGLLFRSGDVVDLSVKMESLIMRPEWCRQLGQAAQRRSFEIFNEERNISQLLLAYEHLLNPSTRGGRTCP